MCCKCCSFRQKQIWIYSVGGTLLTLGIVLITTWPKLSERFVNSMASLSPKSHMFSKWVVTPIPMYFNMYMFNWTNPQQANDSSVKPNFQELGPYVFREVRVKEDLRWDNDENIVEFYNRRTWYFEASKSNGSLEDLITSPHLPTVASKTGAKIFSDRHPIIRKIINFALNREGGKLALTRNVSQWIFEGFYDDILDIVADLHSPILGINEGHFAYFYKRNGSKKIEGTFSIYTGTNHLNEKGDLKYWNGLDHTQYWKGECGRVNGSLGELWPQGRKWHDPASIFISDVKRYLNIYPLANETYRGIEAIRYTSNELTFDSGHRTDDTKCFCVKGRPCPKLGAIDMSTAYKRAPIYLSHPHFNLADPSYRENTTGLNPDREKHIINVLLEPKLGMPLLIDGRASISVLVEKNENIG